ncbi:MAG: hypothetical protein INR63_27105, partial [Actinomycetospora chiangmaiensis]|nr:hypothetical protein [Actinomycetospora chiangmaiensis]
APVASAAPAAPVAPATPPAAAPARSTAAPARLEPRSSLPRPATPPAPGGSNANKRGWLSDLLTRVSLDDDEENPAGSQPAAPSVAPAAPARDTRATPARASGQGAKPPAETGRIALDTISTDIARMIEHRTAVDLWDRYRRGEPNLFGPQIYTAQGQATFSEIQRRYRSDQEFRRSVDRYVSEFERLLADVVKNDPDAKRTDAYLTSETGKVYTMLAHASGRFEGA